MPRSKELLLADVIDHVLKFRADLEADPDFAPSVFDLRLNRLYVAYEEQQKHIVELTKKVSEMYGVS